MSLPFMRPEGAPPSAADIEIAERAVRWRPATMADSAWLLEWRNEEETRRQSFSMDPVTPEQHAAFLARKLHTIRMVRVGYPCNNFEILIGQVRVDEGVVSYSVRKGYRGCGYGTKIIRKLMKGDDPMVSFPLIADVRPSNAASLKVFRKLGWHEADSGDFVRFSFSP